MSRTTAIYLTLLTLLSSTMLAGCGGGDDAPAVAAATPPPSAPGPAASPPTSGGEDESEDESEDGEGYDGGYGGGDYGAGTYGGEGYGGGEEMSEEEDAAARRRNSLGAGAGDGGSGGGSSMGSYEQMMQQSMASEGNGDEYGAGDMDSMYSMGGGYGGEGDGDEMMGGYGNAPGMGAFGGGPGMGGIGGMGGGAGGGAAMAVQFVRQNCGNCHGARQQKGDVRLDGLTANFEDFGNAGQWNSVIEQLEAGTMPPANAPRPDAAQQKMVVDFVRSQLESSGAADADYFQQAEYAFGSGKDKKAMDLLFAHALTADEADASEVLSKTRWFTAGRRPVTTLRFGVAILLDAPSTLTDVKPIGTSQMGGGGGGMGGGMGMGRGGREGSTHSFNSLTGDFGSFLVGSFEEKWISGDFGTVFNDVTIIEPKAPAAGGMGMGRGMGGMGMGGMGMGGGYGGEGDMAGYDQGGYGGEGADSDAGPDAPEIRGNIMPGQVITPGLVYLGDGSLTEMLDRAKERNLDAIFVFDVEATQNRRTNLVNNKTRLRLIMPDGKAVAATKTLVNTEVERAKLRGLDEDDLPKNIDRMFAIISEKMQLTSMPALQPEHAKARLTQLLGQREDLPEDEEPSMNLAVMYEARLYHSMDLITADEMAMVYQIVLEGNEGVTLASGTVDDRELVLDQVLANL